MTILVLTGLIFVIIWEMFHGRIYLTSVLLLLLLVSGFRLELMYISLIEISGHISLTSMVFSCLCCCHRNHFFRLYHRDKSSNSKVKFRQASNHCTQVLEAAKLAYAHKIKESITSQKIGSHDFWWIANIILNKSKSATPLFNSMEVLSSASAKAKLFAENFSKNSNLDYSGNLFTCFPF